MLHPPSLPLIASFVPAHSGICPDGGMRFARPSPGRSPRASRMIRCLLFSPSEVSPRWEESWQYGDKARSRLLVSGNPTDYARMSDAPRRRNQRFDSRFRRPMIRWLSLDASQGRLAIVAHQGRRLFPGGGDRERWT
ncbi:hypothetical protein BD310DRAFT_33290 [Dichomitus squalens]|uniref:Uncharacterized protein n=1 Tax=Dichomitus squalens TaxID=114155 RepID=A0A4Q9QDP1_9APHY|nr:hypothetical protein BD310DRAFT_33290 [Dichomitus squalens]